METEAQQIGETLPAVQSQTDAPRLSAPRTELAVFSSVDFDRLPARLNDTQLAQVEAIANAKLPMNQPCTPQRMGMFLRSIATLKARVDDESTAELKTSLFQRTLGGFSNEAIMYLTERVIREMTFYPTVAECLAILRGHPNTEFARRQKNLAKVRAGRERTERMNEAVEAMKRGELTREAIAALPDYTLKVGETRGYLRREEDGTYSPRPDPWFQQQRQSGLPL